MFSSLYTHVLESRDKCVHAVGMAVGVYGLCLYVGLMFFVVSKFRETHSLRTNISTESTSGWFISHFSDTNARLYEDHLSTETTSGWFISHFSDTNARLYEDHLSTETTSGWFISHFSDTNARLCEDHLSTETTSGWFISHFSDTNARLCEDHLSTETTITCPGVVFVDRFYCVCISILVCGVVPLQETWEIMLRHFVN